MPTTTLMPCLNLTSSARGFASPLILTTNATFRNMRLEVHAYIRMSVKLLELAHEENALTRAERDAIVSLAHDLERQFGPSRQQRDASTDPLLAQLHMATFSADWEVS